MKIWVDADACPGVIRDILFRAAIRTGVTLTLVANQPLNTPAASNISSLQVPRGFDVADDEIVRRVERGDLVITSDIPLAAEVIEKGGQALSPRGELHTTENIRARLNMRDFMDTMRSSAVQQGGGPAACSQRDKQEFANNLDRILARRNAAVVQLFRDTDGVLNVVPPSDDEVPVAPADEGTGADASGGEPWQISLDRFAINRLGLGLEDQSVSPAADIGPPYCGARRSGTFEPSEPRAATGRSPGLTALSCS